MNEAYNLFNAVADQLYGPEDRQCPDKAPGDGDGDGGDVALPEEDNGEEEEDIDAAFEKVRWPISISAFQVNPDTIRIQGIDDQKLKKKNTVEFFLNLFFISKIAKSLQPSSSTSNTEIFLTFFYFCGSFLPSWIRIRI